MNSFKNKNLVCRTLRWVRELKGNLTIQKLSLALSFAFFNFSLLGYSTIIPVKKHRDILRVATYNAHGDQSENSKKESIEAIKHINADILVLQEIMLTKTEIRAFLSFLGYTSFTVVVCAKNGMADATANGCYVICSKTSLAKTNVSKKQYKEYKHVPAIAKIEIDLSLYGKKNLIMYGALFDAFNQKKRLLEVQDLVNLLQKESGQGKNILLSAGFNEERGRVINYLGAHGFINSFDMTGTTVLRPLLSLAQTIGDGIYVERERWNLFCDGSYLFSTQQNKHLSVIIDFDLAK